MDIEKRLELLDEVDDSDIIEYCENRGIEFENDYDSKKMLEDYYHGDFDLISFLKELENEELMEIIKKLI